MYVIRNTSDGYGVAFQILENAGLISPESFTEGRCNKRPTVFGGKNDVGS